MNYLAKVLFNQNKLKQSEDLYRDLIKFWKEHPQKNDTKILYSIFNLAKVLKIQNRI